MTFQDSLIVRIFCLVIVLDISYTLFFFFASLFFNFLNVADFCNQIKKKIEYDYQKMTLYYFKEYKGVFNERI